MRQPFERFEEICMTTSAPIRPLHSEGDYKAALVEYETYFDNEPAPSSRGGDRFELLGMVIAKYEDEHFPIRAPEPVDAIRFAMEQRGFTQADLAQLLGSRSRASEILNRKRELSIDHIRKLHREWHIPAEVLLGEAGQA
jgi:antitoxin component HigA of HigAB toxin-antitoxin module